MAHERNGDGSTSKKTACPSANRLRTDQLHTVSFTHYRYGRYITKFAEFGSNTSGTAQSLGKSCLAQTSPTYGRLEGKWEKAYVSQFTECKERWVYGGRPTLGLFKDQSMFSWLPKQTNYAGRPKMRGMSLPFPLTSEQTEKSAGVVEGSLYINFGTKIPISSVVNEIF